MVKSCFRIANSWANFLFVCLFRFVSFGERTISATLRITSQTQVFVISRFPLIFFVLCIFSLHVLRMFGSICVTHTNMTITDSRSTLKCRTLFITVKYKRINGVDCTHSIGQQLHYGGPIDSRTDCFIFQFFFCFQPQHLGNWWKSAFPCSLPQQFQ